MRGCAWLTGIDRHALYVSVCEQAGVACEALLKGRAISGGRWKRNSAGDLRAIEGSEQASTSLMAALHRSPITSTPTVANSLRNPLHATGAEQKIKEAGKQATCPNNARAGPRSGGFS
jgi:hypothetical protein